MWYFIFGTKFNSLFRRRSKKTSKLRVTGLCVGNSPGPVNSLHKGPVTRKMFPFDDVIMIHAVLLCFVVLWWYYEFPVAVCDLFTHVFQVCLSGTRKSRDDPGPFQYVYVFLPVLGLYSLRRRRLISTGIPIINLRRSSDCLRFIMVSLYP